MNSACCFPLFFLFIFPQFSRNRNVTFFESIPSLFVSMSIYIKTLTATDSRSVVFKEVSNTCPRPYHSQARRRGRGSILISVAEISQQHPIIHIPQRDGRHKDQQVQQHSMFLIALDRFSLNLSL